MEEQIKSLKQQMEERSAEQDRKLEMMNTKFDRKFEEVMAKLDRLLMMYDSRTTQSTPQSTTTTDRSANDSVVGVTEESQKQIQQQTALRANPAELERRLTAETGNNHFSRNLKCDFKLEFPKSEVSSTIAPKMFDESPKKGKLEFVIESELKDKIGEKHDKSEYEVVGEAYEVHSTVETEVFVGCKIEAELEDRKLRVEVKSGKMHHESLLEALHGDNIGFLIFDPGGSTFDASLLKNRKRPRTVTTFVWRSVSTEAKWSIECMVNDQISARDEAGEANELCSSESSSTVSKKYDEGNSLGRNMMTELKWMENLGYEAHRHNSMVDRLCTGKCPVRVSIVQPLAKACGGVLLLHDDFGKAFGVNLQKAFKRAACFHGLLGVRCSDNISVTQVTSPGEEGNNSSLYIQMLSVDEMQCVALAMEIRSDIKSEYVYFQLAVQYSNIYHVDVSRVITVRLPTVTSWVLTVLGYLAKLVLGILGLVVSNAWIAHIVIYLLIDPPLSAILNKVFIKLDDIWGLRGTAAFAFFCMYRLFAVIAWTTMLLCNTTPWTSGFSLDDPNIFAEKSPSDSGNNMAKAVIASLTLVIDDSKNLWVVLVGGFTRNVLVFVPGGADLNYVLTSSFN